MFRQVGFMPSLYLDTTGNLCAGILAEDGQHWLAWKTVAAQKTSAVIYPLLHDLLEQQHLKLAEVSTFYYVAGPGSYTGMRLAEGLAQIVRWKIPVRSFYHFAVPGLLGQSSGLWLCSAFKQEYFVYQWQDQQHTTQLYKMTALKEVLDQAVAKKSAIYTHFATLLPELAPWKVFLQETSSLVYQHPQFLQEISPEQMAGPYYFRGLEQEFKQEKVPTFNKAVLK